MVKETLPQRVRAIAAKYPDSVAQVVRLPSASPVEYQSISYADYWHDVRCFGAGLLSLGLPRGTHAALVSDNRRQWLVVDLAILAVGCVDVPKGAETTSAEIEYIVDHADCGVAVVEDQTQMEKVLRGLKPVSRVKFLVVLDDSLPPRRKAPSSLQLLNYSEVLARGAEALSHDKRLFDREVDRGIGDEVATIIYTSGTTGEPKGVVLPHRSFPFQVDRILPILGITHGHVFLSVLPIWHAYERAIEYVVLLTGATLVYSKPIGKIMLEDMARTRPHWFISVPRIWESVRASIYRSVRSRSRIVQILFDFFVALGAHWADLRDYFLGRWPRYHHHWQFFTMLWTVLPLLLLWPLKALGSAILFRSVRSLLGDRFIAGISGGGSLPGHVDRFFRAIGVLVLEGYGLTECGPVLGVRLQKSPVPTTIGPLLRDIEFRIIQEETGQIVGPGHKGELWVKTPQTMLAYYKKPDATAQVLKEGWLNTGDLAVSTIRGEIRIVGRSKDTIVLRGGENIEPEPIEKTLLQSEFIDQVMVVGQDQKTLAALIVPNEELLERFARDRRIPYVDKEELLVNAQVHEIIHEVIQTLINPRTGFKSFERVFDFRLLSKPFEVGVELTPKLSLKRNAVAEQYRKEIAALFRCGESE